jgi:DNA-binding response OmpR family regulator
MSVVSSHQVRLLVVDDIEDNRNLLSRAFGNRGFQTAQADSGKAALTLIEQQSFDVVLLDIMMPGMDGIEVLKRIRATHSSIRLPVIMVSGRISGMDIKLALDLGANGYITKPIDFSVAFALVQSHLAPKRDGVTPVAQNQSSRDGNGGLPRLDTAAAQRPDRLLVIDDDASICTLIGKLGEKAGFAATRAVSLEEATRLLRAQRYDCVTLDLFIGKNSGIQVLKVLAEMACTTPIIVISGSMSSMRDLAAAIGNMLQLNLLQPFPKPIDFAKLRTTLAGVKEKLELQRHTEPAAGDAVSPR